MFFQLPKNVISFSSSKFNIIYFYSIKTILNINYIIHVNYLFIRRFIFFFYSMLYDVLYFFYNETHFWQNIVKTLLCIVIYIKFILMNIYSQNLNKKSSIIKYKLFYSSKMISHSNKLPNVVGDIDFSFIPTNSSPTNSDFSFIWICVCTKSKKCTD